MAGLLDDFMNTPAGIGLLSAVAGGLAGARKGTPWNNVGRAGVAGVIGYQNEKDNQRQLANTAIADKYRTMQMQQIEQQIQNQNLLKQAGANAAKRATIPGSYGPMGYKPTQPEAFIDQFAQGGTPEDQAFNQANIEAIAQGNNALAPEPESRFDPNAYRQALPAELANVGMVDEALKASQPQNDGRTSEQKNWEYAQTLPEEQRALFMNRAGGASTPATVQEWQYFNSLDPQSQARFLEMKRNPMMLNMGGTVGIRSPGGGVGESYTVTPKITETPEYQAAQETAKVTAKETAQRGAEASSNLPKVQASAANARSMINGVISHPGFKSTVGATLLPGARYVPGTKEADFQSRMDQLKGSAFLQAFETLKGGGQITEVEGKKATDAINRMSISTSENEFKQAAKDFLSVVDRAEQNAIRAARSNPTQGEVDYVRKRRAAGVPDAQVAKEMTANARKQQVQSFDLPPNAKQYEGKTLRDTKSNKRFKSVNGKWQEVK